MPSKEVLLLRLLLSPPKVLSDAASGGGRGERGEGHRGRRKIESEHRRRHHRVRSWGTGSWQRTTQRLSSDEPRSLASRHGRLKGRPMYRQERIQWRNRPHSPAAAESGVRLDKRLCLLFLGSSSCTYTQYFL